MFSKSFIADDIRMDYWMILYILVCVVVGGYSVSTLYQRQQTVGAAISLILLILIFVFYGMRWFEGGGNLKGTQAPSGSWPPIVNFCPDYMTAVKVGSKTYCYYAINMRTGSIPSPGETTVTIGGKQNQSAFPILNSSVSGDVPTIKQDTGSTSKYPLLKTLNTSPEAIIGGTAGQWLKWEGVWDGQQMTVEKAPLPK
jgi:hypothetical protein